MPELAVLDLSSCRRTAIPSPQPIQPDLQLYVTTPIAESNKDIIAAHSSCDLNTNGYQAKSSGIYLAFNNLDNVIIFLPSSAFQQLTILPLLQHLLPDQYLGSKEGQPHKTRL
jgi:hypothetical protein